MDNLHFLQNSQVLLSTMAANQGSKILPLAYPNSPEECREMKKDLLVRILNNTLFRDLLQNYSKPNTILMQI